METGERGVGTGSDGSVVPASSHLDVVLYGGTPETSQLSVGGAQPLQHTDLTRGSTLPHLHSHLTGGSTLPHLHSDLTGGSALPRLHSDLTGGSTLPCLHSELTGGSALPCLHSELTGGSTLPHLHSHLTGGSTLPYLHSHLTRGSTLPLQHTDLTGGSTLPHLHSDLTGGDALPVHKSDLTGGSTLPLLYSDLIWSGTLSLLHPDLTGSSTLRYLHSDLTGRDALPLLDWDLTGGSTLPYLHSDLTEGDSLPLSLQHSDHTWGSALPLQHSDLIGGGTLQLLHTDLTGVGILPLRHTIRCQRRETQVRSAVLGAVDEAYPRTINMAVSSSWGISPRSRSPERCHERLSYSCSPDSCSDSSYDSCSSDSCSSDSCSSDSCSSDSWPDSSSDSCSSDSWPDSSCNSYPDSCHSTSLPYRPSVSNSCRCLPTLLAVYLTVLLVVLPAMSVTQDCGQLPTVQNANVTNDSPSNSSRLHARVTCHTNYRLIGSDVITCLSDGRWDDTRPSCEMVTCASLPTIPNGEVLHSGTWVGSTANYTCIKGFRMVGLALRTCLPSSTWTGAQPQCKRIVCTHPGTPSDGEAAPPDVTDYPAGTTISYSCNTGYNLNGSRTSVCSDQGTWTAPVPQCLVTDCGPPPTLPHASPLLTHTLLGAEVTYICDVGYVTDINTTLMCAINASWYGPVFTCTELPPQSTTESGTTILDDITTVSRMMTSSSTEPSINITPSATMTAKSVLTTSVATVAATTEGSSEEITEGDYSSTLAPLRLGTSTDSSLLMTRRSVVTSVTVSVTSTTDETVTPSETSSRTVTPTSVSSTTQTTNGVTGMTGTTDMTGTTGTTGTTDALTSTTTLLVPSAMLPLVTSAVALPLTSEVIGGDSSAPTITDSATFHPASSGATSFTLRPPPQDQMTAEKAWIIIGVIIGAALPVVLIAGMCYLCHRKRSHGAYEVRYHTSTKEDSSIMIESSKQEVVMNGHVVGNGHDNQVTVWCDETRTAHALRPGDRKSSSSQPPSNDQNGGRKQKTGGIMPPTQPHSEPDDRGPGGMTDHRGLNGSGREKTSYRFPGLCTQRTTL